MKYVFDHSDKLSSSITTFWFKPPKKIGHTAGQFIEMYLPHPNPDERGQKHWFTVSSSPTEPLLSITTKFAGETGSSFKRRLFSLKPGQEVEISEPMGDFVLPKDTSIPLVFVAGGIGSTPFRSIVKWLIDTGEERKIQIILSAKAADDFVFDKIFNQYGVEPAHLVGERLTGKEILELSGAHDGKLFYVSGPEPMVEALVSELEASGISKDRLIGDYFPGYPPPV